MVRPVAAGALVLTMLVGIPILLSKGDDSGAQEIEAVAQTSASAVVTTLPTSQVPTTSTANEPSPQAAQLLAKDETGETAASPATTRLAATSSTAADNDSVTSDESGTAPAPTTAAPTTAAPAAPAPTTAAPTTAAPTTPAPTTAAPTTPAPTTAAPPPSEGPGPEAPTTVPGGQEETDKPSVDLPESSDDPDPIPVVPEPEPADGEPTAEQWRVLRQCESGNIYTIVSGNGLYHGAYQFHPDTWDGVARRAGRSDLVGVLPSDAAPAHQDQMALELWRAQGWNPWPSCGTKAAAA